LELEGKVARGQVFKGPEKDARGLADQSQWVIRSVC